MILFFDNLLIKESHYEYTDNRVRRHWASSDCKRAFGYSARRSYPALLSYNVIIAFCWYQAMVLSWQALRHILRDLVVWSCIKEVVTTNVAIQVHFQFLSHTPVNPFLKAQYAIHPVWSDRSRERSGGIRLSLVDLSSCQLICMKEISFRRAKAPLLKRPSLRVGQSQ